MKKRGKFIVLDGIDGAGKTLQTGLSGIDIFGADKKNHVVLTREPYNSKYYNEIRNLLEKGVDPKENAQQLTSLFVKDRKVHVRDIEFLLKKGFHVICDRYKYSTFAYQQAQGISLNDLIEMHSGMLVPDLVILINIPIKIALERISGDACRTKEVFEKKEFLKKLRTNFLLLPKILSNERIVVIDGQGSVDDVLSLINKKIKEIM
jgi:dTMP kinase